jgi:microsomal epoxide hydrolase
MSYSPPSSAKPFTLNVSDQDLSEWRQLLQLSKLGPTTYENIQSKENYGVTKEWLSNAKDYWLNTYDWRAQEKHINSFDNYRMQIDDIDLHFIALFSEKKDAVPILFMHGWPGSFIEFLSMVELIRKQYEKKDLPYHIIVPSLPGYTLSAELPTDKNWTMEASAVIMHKLMTNLGFDKYLAQGGDIGSFEARLLAQDYDACIGIHRKFQQFSRHVIRYPSDFCVLLVNMMPYTKSEPDKDKLTDFEKQAIEKSVQWRQTGSAYSSEHGTRPATIGHVLSSSPLALLAW